MVEKFRSGLKKRVSETFCTGTIESQFHAYAAIDGITPRFSEGTASDGGDGFTEGEDVVGSRTGAEIIEMSLASRVLTKIGELFLFFPSDHPF